MMRMLAESGLSELCWMVQPVMATSAIPFVPHLPDHDARERELHDAIGFDAVRFRVSAHDFDAGDLRSSLAIPDFGFEVLRRGAALVSSDETKRGPWSGHEKPRSPIADDRSEANFVEVDRDRLRQLINAFGEAEGTNARVDSGLDGFRLIGLSVANDAEPLETPRASA